MADSNFVKPIIVSFPRCGRTWLRVMIGLVICHNKGISTDLCDEERKKLVDATHDGTDKSKMQDYRVLSHDKKQYANRRVLFLLREPKDVVVSAWLHAVKNKGIYSESLKQYMRDPKFGIKKIVAFYNIWFENQMVPKKFKHVWYEHLTRYPIQELAEICTFLQIPHTLEDIKFAVEHSTLEMLHNLEDTKKKNKDPESYYFRRGKIGGFVDYMDVDDINYANNIIKGLAWGTL